VRVLVTGSAGFIGGAVADRLEAQGDEVVRVDLLIAQAHAPGTTAERTHLVDVRDAAALRPLLDGVDVVCHQAAMVGAGVTVADLPAYASHNDLGTAVLLAAMHAAGVLRLVLAGSMVVYGEGRYDCPEHGAVRPGPRANADLDAGRFEPRCPRCGRDLVPGLVTEDAPFDPRSTYAATKAAQEYLVGAWARQTGGTAWSLRYHNVYGPRMPRDTPYAGVASIFRSALERGEAPRVLEDGCQRRDFVHVTDVAAANVVALVTDPPVDGLTAVNVCSGEPHTIGDLAYALAAATRGPEPVIVGGARPGDVRHVVADPARARSLLGFRAEVGFAAGVQAFATDPLRAPARTGRRHRTVSDRGPSTGPSRPEDRGVNVVPEIILPCLDEADALPVVMAALPGGWPVLVVDNGSTDGTAAVARALGARVVTEPRRGYGAAVHAGLESARAELVAVLDGDGSLDPAVLPGMVTAVAAGDTDLALGRRVPQGRRAWPWHARVGNALIAALLRHRGVPVHDVAPVRVARRVALLELGVADRAFGYPLELLLRAGAAGWRISEVPVPYRARAGGRSKVSGSLRGTFRATRDMAGLLR